MAMGFKILINKKRKGDGFTLIELSIVLTIIGLITAGILTGRDLIKAAQVRAQVAQIEKLNTAVNAFRLKYQCLPGDCDHAVASGLGTAGGDGADGNGSGIIDVGNFAGGIVGMETQNFWYHLSKANMIDGTYPVGRVPGINSPPLKLSGMGVNLNPRGGVWIVTSYKNHYANGDTILAPAWLLTSSTLPGPAEVSGVYYADVAYMMDSKIDDGFPSTGSFQTSCGSVVIDVGADQNSVAGGSVGFGVAGGWTDSCYDDTHVPYTYNVSPSAFMPSPAARLCLPIINASF